MEGVKHSRIQPQIPPQDVIESPPQAQQKLVKQSQPQIQRPCQNPLLFLTTLLLGIVIRFGLFHIFEANSELHSFISRRVEISTPTSSWNNFVEGMYLKKHGYSPYASNVFHSSPILLKLFEMAMDCKQSELLIQIIFILCDVIIGINLYYISSSSQSYFLSNPNMTKYRIPKNVMNNKLLLSPYFALFCYSVYYLNPLVILTTCCKSISNIAHALITLSISFSIYGSITISSVILAIATVIDVYPMLLLPIVITMIIRVHNKRCLIVYMVYTTSFVITIIYLFGFNYKYNDSDFNFLNSFYLFMFNGSDITPNIGGWWYFKMSLFNRFQTFFSIILNAQCLVFVLPFIWRFGCYPYFCLYLVIHLFEIFRVYPSLSDSIFGCTFLFISSFIVYNNFKHSLGLICAYFIGGQLMFFMWYMWIEGGTGNANFYYAGNLLYCGCNLYSICIAIASARRYLAIDEPNNADKVKKD